MLKNRIIKCCRNNDILYYNLKYLNRRYVYLRGKVQSALRSLRRSYELGLDINKIIMVKPQDVVYCCNTSSNKFFNFGKVLEGVWDKDVIPFEEYTGIYHAIKDTFIDGKLFEESEFYRRNLDTINRGEIRGGCRNGSDLEARIKLIKNLFNDIKQNGFKQQSAINENKDSLSKFDDVVIHIDRNGHFLFSDGQHRMAIAKILHIEKIPVRVAIRHEKWIKFRMEILNVAKYNGGKIYQKITHPDLCDIPASHGDERIEIIKNHLSLKQGDVLDIGAHWGYFCHHFEEMGFNCFAAEQDPTHTYFLEKLKKAENRKFAIIKGSVLEYDKKTEFDVILALNILHHFIKTERLHLQLIQFLRKLKVKLMFFEPHIESEFTGKGYYRNYNEREFVRFILQHTCLKSSELIGRAIDGRAIYKLER